MDNETAQPSPTEQAHAKLGLRLSKMLPELDIEGYQDGCEDLIFDYTLRYMKFVIRSMARHKRKYKVVCPIIIGKSEKNESNSTKKESPGENLWPWEVKINWDVVKEENIKFLDADDIKNVEERNIPRAEKFDPETYFAQPSTSKENIETDACPKKQSLASSKIVGESSSNVNRKTRSTNKKKSCEEYTLQTVKKKSNEFVEPEGVYCHNKFDLLDMKELLKVDPYVIPLRSVYEIIQMDLRGRLAIKLRF